MSRQFQVGRTLVDLAENDREYQVGELLVNEEISGGAPPDSITITSPTGVRCYQRNGSSEYGLAVSGSYVGSPTDIEYRWDGGSWAVLDASPAGGTFSGTATIPMGQGMLDVRFANDTGVTDSTDTLTVGDVFVIAGQSNAEGRATNVQSHSGSFTLASFREDDAWRLNNDDPTDTGTSNGSIWPRLARHVEADQSSPVILITTAESGTALVGGPWEPPTGANYLNMLAQVTASGVNAVRAILWYQGETDVLNGETEADYETALDAFADAAAAAIAGSPKTCALQLGYTGAAIDGIRKAIADNWDAGGNVFGGPCLYDKTNALHPATDQLIQTTADRYWAALKAELYGGTAGSGRGPKVSSATLTGAQEITVVFNKTLKSGLTFSTAAWTVTDGGGAVTVSSVAYSGGNPAAAVLTLGSAPSGATTVSLGEGTTGNGAVVPLGPDFTLPGGAGTINLPAEPFVDFAVSTATSPWHYYQQMNAMMSGA